MCILADILLLLFLVILLVVFVNLFRQLIRTEHNLKEAYDETEEAALNKIAKKLHIDVAEYLTRRDTTNNKDFKQAIQEKMVEEFFGKQSQPTEDNQNGRKQQTKKQI